MRKSITPLVLVVVAAVALVIFVLVQFSSSKRANGRPGQRVGVHIGNAFHSGTAAEEAAPELVAADGRTPVIGAAERAKRSAEAKPEDSGAQVDLGYWSEATRDRIVPAEAVPVVLHWNAIWPAIEGVSGLADAKLQATAARMRPRFFLEPGQRLDPFAQRAAFGTRETVLRSMVVRILQTMDQEPLSRARLRTLVATFSDEAIKFDIGAHSLAYERTFTRNAVTTRWQVDLEWDVLLDLVASFAELVSDRCQRILLRCADQLRIESARPAQADPPTPVEPIAVWNRPRIVKLAAPASAYETATISDPFRFPVACRDVVNNMTEVLSGDILNCR
jgi:hypothetical protein